VIDHHNPQGRVPDVLALINPKMEDSGYPFKDLAGCGVVFKLYWALLFSRTRYYGVTLTLLNIRPANASYILEAVKIINLMETERISETLVPGVIPFEKSRTANFLSGEEVYVYNQKLQQSQLEKIFTAETSVPFVDLAVRLVELFPVLEGKSLLKIREKSRIARYAQPSFDEIDMLKSLTTSLILKEGNLLSEYMETKLDLVALATLADIMPLLDENRIMVKRGLARLNSRKRPAIGELLLQAGLSGSRIGTREVVWNITPVLNSAGRMGEPDKAVDLFLTESPDERTDLATEVFEMNRLRKKKEESIWESVLSKARRSYESCDEKFIFVSGSFIDRGITGLLAARLVNTFHVPAAVVAELQDRAVGSMRSPQEYSIRDFLNRFEDLLTDYGGHDFAAGFTMPRERLNEFEQKFLAAVNELEGIRAEEEIMKIDAEVPPDYLTPKIRRIVELFEPYGEANPPLVFLTRGLKILSLECFGRNGPVHLKLLLQALQYKWPAILWNGSERARGEFNPGDEVNVVYRLSKSFFQGQEVLQMIIQDIEK
jgi:single-stranded-DNA-specific exonuclease